MFSDEGITPGWTYFLDFLGHADELPDRLMNYLVALIRSLLESIYMASAFDLHVSPIGSQWCHDELSRS